MDKYVPLLVKTLVNIVELAVNMSYKGNLNSHKGRIGCIGEDYAVRYLTSKGHIILSRNLWIKYGEIDVVSIKDRCLYIIEVKTVVKNSILPEEHLDWKKMRKLKGLASIIYNDLILKGCIFEDYVFSVGFVGVILNGKGLLTNIKFEENLEI